MNNVLVLGAGLVAKPLIDYLLDDGNMLTVADIYVDKAEGLVAGHPNGTAVGVDVENLGQLRELGVGRDLVVSLLPPRHHATVAKLCLEYGSHLVTTSYTSDDMRALDGEAREKDLVLLNEMGLDPGIDHMSAMKVIHDVAERGGRVVSFQSATGALPAFEANNNPFGYKVSWSPKGVLRASKCPARWLDAGREESCDGDRLFESYGMVEVPGVGVFEHYANRDSIPYKSAYGLDHATTVYRGTLRNTGWCETMRHLVGLGWLSEEPMYGFEGTTYADLSRHLIGERDDVDIVDATARHLGLLPFAAVLKRMEWLGLFGSRRLPEGAASPLDCLHLIAVDKMALRSSERDMIVMHHDFVAELPEGRMRITSTLVDVGRTGYYTAIARTVGLPAAIAAKLIMRGTISEPGVHIPVSREIYEPILDELDRTGLRFEDRQTSI